MTATTPGSFRALETSMCLIKACGTGLRRSLANSIRGRTMSSAKRVCPMHFARASTLRNGLPTTFSSASPLCLPLCFFIFNEPFAGQLPVASSHLKPVNTFSRRLDLFTPHPGGCQLDRFIDLYVARASAKIPSERLLDLVPLWAWVFLQQLFRNEQKRRRAVSALRGSKIGECFLQRMKLSAFSHAFDRSDFAVFSIKAEKETRQNRLAVDQNRADAALAQLASVLRSGQREVLAQHFKQRLVW